MKRMMSLALAMILLLGVVFSACVTVSADAITTASDACIEILKAYEGFSEYPYEDYGQLTVGWGTKCPADKEAEYKENGITEEQADELLKIYVENYEKDVVYFANKYALALTQNQFDALFLFTYNCGSGWIYSNSTNFHKTMANPNASADDVLFYFGLWSNAGNVPLNGLIKRRMSEANIYLNGVYSRTTPANYNYVKYDAMGGMIEGRVHVYNTDTGEKTPLTPSYSGRTFEGWFTEETGGTKVTALNASVNGLTLYARWSGGDETTQPPQEQPKEFEIEPPLTVKVTTDELNVRKGPGTNYVTVGSVFEGDQLSLTKAAYDSSGRLWGQFDKGWVCLQYTNFEEAMSELNGTEPEEKPSEPAPSEPAPTEPAPSEPTPTEPAPTEPAPSTPSEPAPSTPSEPAKEMGTVTANGCLYIRSGAGTGYSKVGEYKTNARIEILEQKVNGAMVWGRTDKGWVSMSYVKLDSANTQTPEQNTGSSSSGSAITGTVKVNGVLNIRTGAGTSYGIAGYYSNGTKVTITEQKTNGGYTWGKTDKGWISMTYVVTGSTGSTSSGSSSSSGAASGSANANATVKVTSVLNIRNGAGTTCGVVGYYKNGTRVEILEQKTVGSVTWGRTDKGWVSMDYVTLDSGSSSGGAEAANPNLKTVTASCLNIRAEANTTSKVVGYLYKGSKVEVTETKVVGDMTWGKTAKGWIAMQYVQ